MHTKTAFFNTTVLKKDLTRFLPLWTVYLILGVLLAASNMGNYYYSDAMQLGDSLQWVSVALCIYALLASQLLFGELFQGRMCNAIHALPVRREGLFISHFTAGILMGIGPNVIIALISMLSLGRLWFVALLWLGAVSMIYLLFFGVAVFCMMCSGNRFAAVALYALVNLLGVIVLWFFSAFYIPLLYGMELTDPMRNYFYIFSPAVKMAEEADWITITHAADCMVDHESAFYERYDCIYHVTGYGKIWGYLGIMAAVGLIFSAAALALYRKRHLETAGDFLSVKPVGILFTLVASACVGGLCYYIAAETFIGMAVGLVVGFFLCRMLLERTIKVFGKKNWLQLIAFCLVVALSFGLTYFDAFGVASRVPDTQQIRSVTIADSYLSEWELDNISLESPDSQVVTVAVDPYYAYGKEGKITLTEPADIDVIREVHRLLLQEGDARQNYNHDYNMYNTVTLHYVLKNGTTMTRYYYTAKNSPASQRLAAYVSTPAYTLGFETPEEMAKFLRMVYWYDQDLGEITDKQWLEKLAAALFADAVEGNLVSDGGNYAFEMQLEYEYDDGRYGGTYLGVPETAVHTLQWRQEYDAWWKENNKTAA